MKDNMEKAKLFREVEGFDPRELIVSVPKNDGSNETVTTLPPAARIEWLHRWAAAQDMEVRIEEKEYTFEQDFNHVIAKCEIYFVKVEADWSVKERLVAVATAGVGYNKSTFNYEAIVSEAFTNARGRALTQLGFPNLGQTEEREIQSIPEPKTEEGFGDTNDNGSQIPSENEGSSKNRKKPRKKSVAITPDDNLGVTGINSIEDAWNYVIRFGSCKGKRLEEIYTQKGGDTGFLKWLNNYVAVTEDVNAKTAAFILKGELSADEDQ